MGCPGVERALQGAVGVENDHARLVHHVLVVFPKTESELPRQHFRGFRRTAQEMPTVPIQSMTQPVLVPVRGFVVLWVVTNDDDGRVLAARVERLLHALQAVHGHWADVVATR